MRKILFLLVALFVVVPVALTQEKAPVPSPSAQLFDYDQKLPPDVQQKATYERPGCTVVDITYASPKGGRVPAFLVLPKGKGPFAAILFAHWGNGNRTEFLPEAELYAQVGVISSLPDYPWDRPAPWHRGLDFSLSHPEQDKETYIQAVMDMRRGLDLLLARSDVDAKRIAYVGHSYGAQWGAILAAIDGRLKALVLVGGTRTLADVLQSNDPGIAELRKSLKPGLLEKYIEVNRPLDAVNFVSYAAPIPILFQFARFEQYFSQASMDRYWQAAKEPKAIQWYDTGHDLNDLQTLLDRAAWLEKQIRIASITPFIEKQLGRKPG